MIAAWYAQVILIIHAERMTGTEYLAKYPNTSSFLLKMGTCDEDTRVMMPLSETRSDPTVSQNTTSKKREKEKWARNKVVYFKRKQKPWFNPRGRVHLMITGFNNTDLQHILARCFFSNNSEKKILPANCCTKWFQFNTSAGFSSSCGQNGANEENHGSWWTSGNMRRMLENDKTLL